MDLLTAVHGRRTIHDYLPDPVPPGVLDRALEAAHQAPCHRLTWPWRFTRLGPIARAVVADAAVALKAGVQGLDDRQRDAIRRKTLSAPELLVVSQVLPSPRSPTREREDYAAVACAVQNLMLSLHADGFGSKWSTGGITTAPETYAAAGLDPEVEPIVGFVWIGRPAAVPAIERPPWASTVRTTA